MLISFEDWLKQVDYWCFELCGLSHNDLYDAPYKRWYDSRVKPASAARRAVAATRRELGL